MHPTGSARPVRSTPLSGTLAVVWGDPPLGPPHARYFVTDERDPCRRIELAPAGALARRAADLRALAGRRVLVRGVRRRPGGLPAGLVTARAVRAEPLIGRAAFGLELSGPTPWLCILCKFADRPGEPAPPAHVEDMLGDTYPRLAHYWNEVSYGQISLTGSRVVGWYRLPGSHAEYVDEQGNPNLGLLFDHATAAAANDVDFTDYYGVSLFFNDGVGCCNWGTRWRTTLGGVTRDWGVAWLPPTALRFVHDVAHEMGHGYGLPHSNEDVWDVMSWGTCGLPTSVGDPKFGCVDVHTITYHKDTLGWISEERRITVAGGRRTLTLERLALPGPAGYLMAQAPVRGSATRSYIVEARRRAGYDAPIPGDAVVIHEIDTTRPEPAWPVKNPARGDDLWLPAAGQDTFTAAAAGITVTVLREVNGGTGFEVMIANGAATTPAPPTNLRLGAVTANSIELRWDDNSDDGTELQMWWLPAGGSDWTIVPLLAGATTWTHAGLQSGARFTYYVRACNAAGCSDWSNGVRATTAAGPPPAPSNLRLGAVTANSIELAWDDTSTSETSMRVWYTPAGHPDWMIVTLSANVTAWIHEGLQPGSSFSYAVQACNDAGCSGFSNTVRATTTAPIPTPPSGLRTVAVTPTSVELSWRDNSSAETRFQVWWLPAGGDTWTIVEVAANATAWTHTGLTPGGGYVYYVRACNDTGCSAWSNAARVTTPQLGPPAAPSNLRVAGVTATSIRLTWTDNATNATRTQVWRTPAGRTDWTIENVGPDVTDWMHTGLTPGQSFDYWVQACTESDCSGFSNGVRATTSGAAGRAAAGASGALPPPPGSGGVPPVRPAAFLPPAGAGPRQARPAATPPPAGPASRKRGARARNGL